MKSVKKGKCAINNLRRICRRQPFWLLRTRSDNSGLDICINLRLQRFCLVAFSVSYSCVLDILDGFRPECSFQNHQARRAFCCLLAKLRFLDDTKISGGCQRATYLWRLCSASISGAWPSDGSFRFRRTLARGASASIRFAARVEDALDALNVGTEDGIGVVGDAEDCLAERLRNEISLDVLVFFLVSCWIGSGGLGVSFVACVSMDFERVVTPLVVLSGDVTSSAVEEESWAESLLLLLVAIVEWADLLLLRVVIRVGGERACGCPCEVAWGGCTGVGVGGALTCDMRGLLTMRTECKRKETEL